MRSTLLNRSNSNILGIRQDRRVAAVKNVLSVVVMHAQSFFFRHMSPMTASYGPRCWHAAPPARQSAVGS